MRSLLVASLLLLLAVIPFINADTAASLCCECCTDSCPDTKTTIFAGQTIDAADLTIEQSGDSITFHIAGRYGWEFTEIHIYIGTTEPASNGQGGPAPGQFPIKLENLALTVWDGTYSLADYVTAECDQTLYIVVHLSMRLLLPDGTYQEETGFADGDIEWDLGDNRWGWTMRIEKCCDVPTCSTGGDDGQGCTYTRGYWATHWSGARQKGLQVPWPNPPGEDATLCGIKYMDIFNTAPRGNPFYILGAQWAAATLNAANGASTPTDVSLTAAETLLTQYCEDWSLASEEDRSQALAWSALLDDYNNGVTGPGHCGDGECACACPPPPSNDGCSLTQGYYRTHNKYATTAGLWKPWPIDEDTFLCAQTWYEILNTSPRGDGWNILAIQWIAATLNAANDATMTVVASELLRAETILNTNCMSINRDTQAALREEAIDIAAKLADFNLGNIGPGHCNDGSVIDVSGSYTTTITYDSIISANVLDGLSGSVRAPDGTGNVIGNDPIDVPAGSQLTFIGDGSADLVFFQQQSASHGTGSLTNQASSKGSSSSSNSTALIVGLLVAIAVVAAVVIVASVLLIRRHKRNQAAGSTSN